MVNTKFVPDNITILIARSLIALHILFPLLSPSKSPIVFGIAKINHTIANIPINVYIDALLFSSTSSLLIS
jgi:hypothetical protein